VYIFLLLKKLFVVLPSRFPNSCKKKKGQLQELIYSILGSSFGLFPLCIHNSSWSADKSSGFDHPFATKMSTSSEACSRALSRRIRTYLNREVYPQLPVKPHELPEICQINPILDMYAIQENSKDRIAVNEWKCGLCKKVCSTAVVTSAYSRI
jgi:hypothetical protein